MASYHGWHLLPERRLLRQRLLGICGFLNYVVRTYPWLNPYTKGLHLTIGGWRDNRDPEGWRVRPKGSGQLLSFWCAHDDEQTGNGYYLPPPQRTRRNQRESSQCRGFGRDTHALVKLTSTDDPPQQQYWGAIMMLAFYMPGDARSAGFGSFLIGDDSLLYEFPP